MGGGLVSFGTLLAGLLPAAVIGWLGYRYLYNKTQLMPSKVVLAVMLGVVVAIPAYYIESGISHVVEADMSIWWQAMIVAFFTVAFVEELFKSLVLYVSNYVVPVDEPMDLLAIALLIAMGFAGVENILYSYSKGWEVALFRSLTAVPAHACFAFFAAYFVSMNFPQRKSITPYLQGLLLAWVFHGFYDFFIIQDISEHLMLMALVILVICIYLSMNVYKRVKQTHRVDV